MSEFPEGYRAPRILLVDDDESFLSVMRVHLGNKGYLVIEAMNGRDGVESSGRDHPDLILMDLRMPRLDGLSAIDQIHRTALSESIPIIAISSFYEEAHREKAKELGCVACLDKCEIFDTLDMELKKHLPDPADQGFNDEDVKA